MEQACVSKYDSKIEAWYLIKTKPTLEYIPRWKRIIAQVLDIPIKPQYRYKVRIKIYNSDFLKKGYCVRFSINGEWRYFTVKGTEHFSGTKEWILESAIYEEEKPNETYGKDTLIQLIHKGIVPEYEPI